MGFGCAGGVISNPTSKYMRRESSRQSSHSIDGLALLHDRKKKFIYDAIHPRTPPRPDSGPDIVHFIRYIRPQ